MSYSNATFFLDFEGGSDSARTALTSVSVANNGSGAVRCTKTAHGLVTGAVGTASLNYAGDWKITRIDADNFDLIGSTYSTATALTFTPFGGSSKTDAWKTISAGPTAARIAPGDTIRLMGSPDPTSLGVNGTWTDGPLPATASITSSTNATPIVITYNSTSQFATGDTVIVNAHTTNTKANGVWEVGTIGGVSGAYTAQLLDAQGNNSVGNGVGGATGTIRKYNHGRVMLASAVTANVALNGNQGIKTNWTASANVTNTVITTDNKEGGECQQIAVGASFTTGLAAYFATGTLDLSGYQQLSFAVKQTAGTLGAASSLTLRLCSDTAGVTTVDTFNIPAFAALNQWMNFTVDKGANMGNAIASIAFDVNTDNGAQTFLFDNIIACKAASANDSLSRTSLIGKNTAGETWLGIASINGKRVMLDMHINSRPTTSSSLPKGYSGTSETVTTYKRETIKWTMTASGATTVQAIQDSGTEGNPITFSGGWNRTDMTTQTGETWYDGQNGFGNFLADQSAWTTIDKMGLVRFNSPHSNTFGVRRAWTNFHTNNMTGNGFSTAQGGGISYQGYSCCNGSQGFTLTYADNSKTLDIVVFGNGGVGVQLDSSNCEAQSVICKNNNQIGGGGFVFGNGCNNLIKNLVTSGNATFEVGVGGANNGGGSGPNYLYNASITAHPNGTIFPSNATQQRYSNMRIISEKHQGVAGATFIVTDGGQIESESSVRHTASGYAWKLSPILSHRTTNYPLDFEIARVAVAANTLVTVKAWLRRTNTGLTHRLVCKGGQIDGVAADVTASMTASADTWEEVTITFTPTASGVVIITVECYGTANTYSGYVDDMTITQA